MNEYDATISQLIRTAIRLLYCTIRKRSATQKKKTSAALPSGRSVLGFISRQNVTRVRLFDCIITVTFDIYTYIDAIAKKKETKAGNLSRSPWFLKAEAFKWVWTDGQTDGGDCVTEPNGDPRCLKTVTKKKGWLPGSTSLSLVITKTTTTTIIT